MLKVDNLWIKYDHVEAVRGIHFEVKKGEIVALIGANGAGKTSTLMGISGLVEKNAGDVFFLGENITNLSPSKIVRLGISHIPEGRHIFPQMSVEENIFMGTFGRSGKPIGKLEIERKKEEMYAFFPRLKERCKQMGSTLSGGEQQMLAIARGLMFDPELIIFDEPSLGLAPIIIDDVYEKILQLRAQGKTILLVEQNASIALEAADRGYVLENGSITLEGKGRDLLVDPEVKRAYLGI